MTLVTEQDALRLTLSLPGMAEVAAGLKKEALSGSFGNGLLKVSYDLLEGAARNRNAI